MNLYYYLHYFIYKKYEAWGEAHPDLYATGITAMLTLFNIILFFWLMGINMYDYIVIRRDLRSILIILPYYYLHEYIVYNNDRHIKKFANLEANEEQTKRYSTYVIIYIIGSLISFIGYGIYKFIL